MAATFINSLQLTTTAVCSNVSSYLVICLQPQQSSVTMYVSCHPRIKQCTCMSLEWCPMSWDTWSSNQPSFIKADLSCSSSSFLLALTSHKRSHTSCIHVRIYAYVSYGDFHDRCKNVCVASHYKFFLRPVSGEVLLWYLHVLSYHQICCSSASATETLTPASSLDASGNDWTSLYTKRLN